MTLIHERTQEDCASDPKRTRSIASQTTNEKRARILESATGAFMARGFDNAILADIATAAGVGKLAIYRYFDDKADLFAQCVLHEVRQAGASLAPLLTTARPIEEVLVKYAETHVAEMLRPVTGGRPFYEIATIIIGTLQSKPELANACQAIFRQNIGRPLVEWIRLMEAKGEIEASDPEFLAEYFTQTAFFTISIMMDPTRAPKIEDLHADARRRVSLFLHGCRRTGI